MWTDNAKTFPCNKPLTFVLIAFFQNIYIFEGFNKNKIRQLVRLATNESHFLFNEIFLKQVLHMKIGFPVGFNFANDFLALHEKHWLKDCPIEFYPACYQRYFNDIFVLWKSPKHLFHFLNYLNPDETQSL